MTPKHHDLTALLFCLFYISSVAIRATASRFSTSFCIIQQANAKRREQFLGRGATGPRAPLDETPNAQCSGRLPGDGRALYGRGRSRSGRCFIREGRNGADREHKSNYHCCMPAGNEHHVCWRCCHAHQWSATMDSCCLFHCSTLAGKNTCYFSIMWFVEHFCAVQQHCTSHLSRGVATASHCLLEYKPD